MGAETAVRAGQAYIELFAEKSKLDRDLKGVEKGLITWGTRIAKAGLASVAAGTAILAPLTLAADQFADVGGALDDMSQRTGVSVERLGELSYAAKMSGTSIDAVEDAMKKLDNAVQEAAAGSVTAAKALGKVGLTARELKNLSPNEQLKRVSDGLAGISHPGERASAALDLFGKSGTDLLPLLQDGSEQLKNFADEANRLGLVMSSEDAASAAELGDALDDLKLSLHSIVTNTGAALAPLLKETAKLVTENVATISKWIKQNRGLVVTVALAGATLIGAGVAIVGVGAALAGLSVAAGYAATAFTVLGAVISGTLSLIGALLSPVGLLSIGIIALAYYLLTTSETGQAALSELARWFDNLKTDALKAIEGIGDALAAGDISLAAKILWTTLKLEWQRGINALMEAWRGIEEPMTETFARVTNAVTDILIDMIAGVKIAFNEAFKTIFEGFITLQEQLGKFDKQQADLARDSAGFATEILNNKARREAAAALAASKTAAELAKSRREDARGNAARENSTDLSGLEKELDDLRAQAAKEKADTLAARDRTLKGGVAETRAVAAGSSSGTFSGVASTVLGVIGQNSIQERMLRLEEQTKSAIDLTNLKLDRLIDAVKNNATGWA